jgi:uncharacterized protein (TIGR00369 family)
MKAHYQLLEQLYLKAPTNEYYLPTIKVSEKHAEITINVQPKFYHAANAVHGSVYFKLLDDAAFFAANSIEKEYFVLTGTFEIKLLKPVTKGTLKAIGKVLDVKSRTIVASSELFNDDKLVATGKGVFVKSSISLDSL